MKSSARTLKPYLLSLLATAFPNALGFLAFPLYAKALGAEDYGVAALLEAYQGFLSIVLFAGMGTAYYVFYSHAKDDLERKKIFAAALYFGVALWAFILPVSCFSPKISTLLISSQTSGLFIAIYAFSLFSDYILTLINTYLRIEGKISWLAVNAIVISLVHHGLSFYLVVLGGGGLAYFIAIFFISKAVAVAISAFHIFRCRLPTAWGYVDKALIKKMLKFGAPLILTSLTGWVLLLSDRLFINYYVSMGDVGIYAVGYKFAMGLWIGIVQPFMTVWEPTLFKAYHANPMHGYAKLERDFSRYLAGIVILFSAFVLFIREILEALFAGSEYAHETEIIYLLAGSYFLMAVGEMCASVCRLHKTSRYALWVALGVTLTKVVLNVGLIPHFLLIGAAIASVVAEMISQCIMVTYAARLTRPINLFFGWPNALLIAIFLLTEIFVQMQPSAALGLKAAIFLGLMLIAGGILKLKQGSAKVLPFAFQN